MKVCLLSALHLQRVIDPNRNGKKAAAVSTGTDQGRGALDHIVITELPPCYGKNRGQAGKWVHLYHLIPQRFGLKRCQLFPVDTEGTAVKIQGPLSTIQK